MDGANRGDSTPGQVVDPLVGRVLAGRYEVTELLSLGGMGRVYRGIQRALDRVVAIKCIHPHLSSSEEVVARFLTEARVASRLTHPNVVKIYDFGRLPLDEGGQLYLIMELLAGEDLATVLERGDVLGCRRIASILGQVLSALAEAHAADITHRDVKPENIFVDLGRSNRDSVKLIDFGIARAHGMQRITSSGHFVGTPHYMPPELIRGEPADAGADLYAVGVTLFYMLTGQLLFDDASVMRVLERQLYSPRPDPREVAPERDVPAALSEVCLRAIDIERARRFPDAESFAQALERAASSLPGASARPTPVHRATASSRAPTLPSTTPPPASLSAPPAAGCPASRTWASITPAAPSSTRHRLSEAPSFAEFQRLEAAAARASEAGDTERAVRLLRRGLRRAEQALEGPERAMAEVACTAFARRLGALLRAQGKLAEAQKVLHAALTRGSPGDATRALLLEQVALCLRAAGDFKAADACLIEALRAAGAAGDRELVDRLKRSGTRPLASNSDPQPDPTPRRSDFRVKDSQRPPLDDAVPGLKGR
jgi:serine/threonine-protein kinase